MPFYLALVLAVFTSLVSYAADTEQVPRPATAVPSPGAAEPTSPAQWYGAGVRPTEPRTPAQEREGFHLPDGFQIELFAAEPQIAKPLNMAFDFGGRLWVTDTVEYPYPAPTGRQPRDSIKILEDTTGDHRADRVTVFADKLNVPMGLLPYGDGAIVFSIPNLYYLRDTDGDGVCDRREVILGPFDTTRDTHGMVNSLRQGFDGWIYACHGFNNQSKVAGTDGWQIEMTSGNTFRFRPDGSRVEHLTFGQVNPFGLTCDAWGNWFSADCHSKPITQLIRGGQYPGFGRSDDGLGFVPSMMDHLHGSTAIAGLVFYDSDGFPAPYRDQFYSGNVMTSRINRNAISQLGATLRAIQQPDFLTSDDPWFRPVDLQIAADGSLYVADFYNRIIGHYEVPLDHPGRDRHRGRIWRISGPSTPPISSLVFPFTAIDNTTHLRTLNYVADAETERAKTFAEQTLDEPCCKVPYVLWFRFRRGLLTDQQWQTAAAHEDPRMRTHAMLIAGEMPTWTAEIDQCVQQHIADEAPFAARAAAEACGRHPSSQAVEQLLARLPDVDSADTIMRQTIRIAVRDSLLDNEVAAAIKVETILAGDNSDEFMGVLMGTRSEPCGRWLAAYLATSKKPVADELPLIRHAISNLPPAEIDALVDVIHDRDGLLPGMQKQLLLEIITASAIDSGAARRWAWNWCDQRWSQTLLPLVSESTPRLAWQRSDASEDWPREPRQSSAGATRTYRSTFGLGETYVGKLRSDTFALPRSLSFEIVGHDGFPKEAMLQSSELRLIDASSGEVLRREPPPRSDTAKRIHWDLAEVVGHDALIEVVDGNAAGAYAWIALGDFDDARLNDDALSGELQAWFEIAHAYQLNELAPRIKDLLGQSTNLDASNRLELLGGLVKLRKMNASIAIVEALQCLPNANQLLDDMQPVILAGAVEPIDLEWLKTATIGLTRASQQALAKSLAARRESLPWLIAAASEGWIAGDVLRLKAVESSINSLATEDLQSKIAEVLSALPDEDEALKKLASDQLNRFASDAGNAIAGAAVFQKHCAVCHQIAGVGAVVGPQLDGIGSRGAERLLEDMFQPDRNVDGAFRTTTLVLDEGTVVVGLIQNETPNSIEIVDNAGKKRTIQTPLIEQRKTNSRSLMPGGLHEAMGEQGVHDLLAFLLGQREDREP